MHMCARFATSRGAYATANMLRHSHLLLAPAFCDVPDVAICRVRSELDGSCSNCHHPAQQFSCGNAGHSIPSSEQSKHGNSHESVVTAVETLHASVSLQLESIVAGVDAAPC